ncbi:MAG: putative sugar O-methyltransferase [Rhodospirillales bacterium]|nr:putative sugar O-methyltransferase [Rhodospirillales bacterium]
MTTPLVWTDDHVSSEDMLYFRGDNAYVWQVRKWSMNIMVYALTTYYVRSIDTLGLLDKLEEDDDFGIHTVQIDNKRVSRDLLDSIVEIHFLEKHLGISSRRDVTVLDIGAGYGRLAHRMLGALPNISRYLCTDAVPVSTFVCEHYLRHRRLDDRAKVVPLDEIEDTVSAARVDVAVNVHSFSECRLPAIDWWLSLLAKNNVKYLMIVPNTDALKTKDGQDFTPIIEQHGYRLKAAEPKFSDPVVQQYGINPVHHYLFELREHRSG